MHVIHGPGIDSDHHLLLTLVPFPHLGLIILIVLFSRSGLPILMSRVEGEINFFLIRA